MDSSKEYMNRFRVGAAELCYDDINVADAEAARLAALYNAPVDVVELYIGVDGLAGWDKSYTSTPTPAPATAPAPTEESSTP